MTGNDEEEALTTVMQSSDSDKSSNSDATGCSRCSSERDDCTVVVIVMVDVTSKSSFLAEPKGREGKELKGGWMHQPMNPSIHSFTHTDTELIFFVRFVQQQQQQSASFSC